MRAVERSQFGTAKADLIAGMRSIEQHGTRPKNSTSESAKKRACRPVGYGRIDVLTAYERLDRQLNGALGDMNCDGAVTMTDALLIARLVSGLVPQLAYPGAADVDGDGNVMMTDALLVARLTLGLD